MKKTALKLVNVINDFKTEIALVCVIGLGLQTIELCRRVEELSDRNDTLWQYVMDNQPEE